MEEIKEEKVEEKKTKKRKKKSWVLVTILVILLLIAATIGGYLAGASKIADLVVKQRSDKQVVTEENTKEETTTKEDTPKCTGKYYGEFIGSKNGINFDYRYTYELKADGTYTVNYSDVQQAEGKYLIIDNSICFAEPLEIVGPGDNPHYSAYCNYIKEDCSSMTKYLTDAEGSMELKKTA